MRLLTSIIFGIVYTVGYIYLALIVTGGGHGNFTALLLIPTWIFNFIALFLLTKLKTQMMKVFFIVLMSVYYLVNFLILLGRYTDKETNTHFSSVAIPIIWYISGQLIIWAVFIRESVNAKSNKLS